MKKFIIACLYILNVICLGAQTPQLEWGPELVRPRRTEIAGFLGCDKNSFYCVRNVRSFFSVRIGAIEKYSKKTMTLEYVKEFKMPEVNGKELQYEDMFILNGQILVFSSAYFSDQNKKIAYVQKINTNDGSLAGQPKEIDQIVADKKRNSGSFSFIVSNDSTKILIARNDPYEKYANEKFSYKLLDANTNIIWSASLELPYKDKYFSISNYRVDNSGKVYMLASVMKEKEDREKKKPSYSYNLISYNNASKSLKEMPISLGDKYISDIRFAITPKGNIAVGGFYSNKNAAGLAGTFFMSVDKEKNQVLSQGTKDFSSEFLTEFMSARHADKHKELYNYSVDYLVSQSNGGLIMVAEQFYVNVVTTCQPKGGCTTTYYYNYNDIIVVSFNPDASVKWMKHIPKTQVSANDGGYHSSYSFVVTNDKLNFIYNDNPKNLKPDADPKRTKNGISKKMVTVIVGMNISDGNFNKTSMFSAKEERIYTIPKIAMQLSKNQSLFYAIKRKKFKFAIITY